ncbi:calpain-9-like [Schistocerca nitens]|uniref:calpain-9-like n=1 Tax=Schistocerca nitens TaxID=7011 RepID=UPI0021191994|nr:calpain-9-like [Schistocerca nitens]
MCRTYALRPTGLSFSVSGQAARSAVGGCRAELKLPRYRCRRLHGSYESLAGGHALEALVDLTGGVAEKLRSSAALYPLLRDAFARGDLVTCAKKGNWASMSASRPAVTESGLARGHAYTVREVRQVRQAGRRPLRMVRVRNPWADHREWTGAWSDGDGRWQLLDEETRRQMGALQPAPDGEFWMEFSDFQRHFSEITVATLVPDLDCDADGVEVCHGEWVAGRSAGGCRNDISKFTTNPQFLLTLTTSDGDDVGDGADVGDGGGGGGVEGCGVLVALMQELRRAERSRLLRALPIAVFLYKAGEPPVRRLDAAHFEKAAEVSSSGPFVNSREVVCRARLPAPAAYVLVPAAFHPGHGRAFMLRVFSQRPFHLHPLRPD